MRLRVTFWEAFRTIAKDAGRGALTGVLITGFILVCAWLASTGRYITSALFAVVVIVGTLAILARNMQRRAAEDERKWRALGFGNHKFGGRRR